MGKSLAHPCLVEELPQHLREKARHIDALDTEPPIQFSVVQAGKATSVPLDKPRDLLLTGRGVFGCVARVAATLAREISASRMPSSPLLQMDVHCLTYDTPPCLSRWSSAGQRTRDIEALARHEAGDSIEESTAEPLALRAPTESIDCNVFDPDDIVLRLYALLQLLLAVDLQGVISSPKCLRDLTDIVQKADREGKILEGEHDRC